jgi:hypothetical protein
MKRCGFPIMLLCAISLSLAACGGGAEESATSGMVVTDVAVGDPSVSYANVEFTGDGRYMVWFEQLQDGTTRGTVWHCGINPDTGALIPPDGKGFNAFASTLAGRANPGMDDSGPYYVGMDRQGVLVLVRPTSATTGTVTVLPTPADNTRRAVYPTDLPDAPPGSNRGYVFWIKNEAVPGPGNAPGNNWFELQYIDLADPATVRVIERQDKPAEGFPPMDIAFARWFRGKASLTYGFFDGDGLVQIREFDLDSSNPLPIAVTNDPSWKVDPFPFVSNGQHFAIAGINSTVTSHVYQRQAGTTLFQLQETISPPASSLTTPILAQSHERILFDGALYTAYQVNEPGSDFQDTAFSQTGEIWLSTVLQPNQRQWRVSQVNSLAKSEPEPYVGTSKVWIFYSALPRGADIYTAKWSLHRADTPLAKRN